MVMTVLTAIAVYVATGIDYLIILIILFSQTAKTSNLKHIIIGQYLGTIIIILISLLGAFGATLIPQQWMVGLLGLLPIYLGIKVWVKGEGETEESNILSIFSSSRFNQLFLTVTLIVLASSADDLSIYVPYFTTLSLNEISIVVLVFLVMVGVLCYISYQLASVHFISEKIEKYEKWIVPVVFIGLGIYIMLENGVFGFLI